MGSAGLRDFGQPCSPHLLPPSPLCPGCGGPQAASSNKEPVPSRGLGLGAGLPALPAPGLLGKTHPRVGAGGRETDDFIFFKGDSQFVHLLITWAPELEFHGWEDEAVLRVGLAGDVRIPFSPAKAGTRACPGHHPQPCSLGRCLTLRTARPPQRCGPALQLRRVTNSSSRSWSRRALHTAVYYSTLCWQPVTNMTCLK